MLAFRVTATLQIKCELKENGKVFRFAPCRECRDDVKLDGRFNFACTSAEGMACISSWINNLSIFELENTKKKAFDFLVTLFTLKNVSIFLCKTIFLRILIS